MSTNYYPDTISIERRQKQEDVQRIAIIALAKAGFFNEAAFYGGTCLRMLHGLDRFSEDLDFSVLKKDETFSFEKYFPAIIEEFAARGRKVEARYASPYFR